MRSTAVRLAVTVVAMIGAFIALGSAAGGQPTEPRIVPGVVEAVEGDGEAVTLEVPVTLSESSPVIVTAQWETRFGPGVNPPDPAEPGVDFVAVTDGVLTFMPGDTEEVLSVTVIGDDLEEADEFVVVKVHSPTDARIGGFWGLGFGLILDDDAPPPPEITVTPDTGLNGGDVVTVSGTNWPPGATVGMCQADAVPASPPQAGCRSGTGALVQALADASGAFSAQYRLSRWAFIPARGGFIDCTDAATPCVLGAGEISGGALVGPTPSVPLSFAQPLPPPATRGTITVAPSVDLTDGETLTVTGTGFRADAQIELYPCIEAPMPPNGCDYAKRVDTAADAGGAFTTTMPAHQYLFGLGVNCAKQACVIGAAEAVDFVGTLTTAPFSFLPRIVPGVVEVVEGDGEAVTLEVPVTLSMASGSTVTAQWETLAGPGVNPPNPAEPGVDFVAVTDGSVTFMPGDTEETISITVLGDDLEEADEFVVARFHSPTNAAIGGFWGLGFGLILDDDEPPPPSITVTPDTGLNGGDVVTVTGANWPPGANVGMCQADAMPADPPEDACRSGTGSIVQVPADANGAFSVPYRIIRWGFIPARGGFIDCTDPATPCVLGAAEVTGGAPVGPTAVAPLSFAVPDPPPAIRGEITVTPSVDLIDGQTLTVTGTGFRAGAEIELYPCLAPVSPPDNCGYAMRVDTAADAAGAFQTTMTASQFIFGTQDCAARPCAISASEAVDFLGTFTTAPIAFAPPPSPPSIEVAPSTDLEGGQVVIVSGAGFTPGATVGVCQAIPSEPAEDGCFGEGAGFADAVTTTADVQGEFSLPFELHHWGAVDDGQLDCTFETCLLIGADLADVSGTVASWPLSFAPWPPPPTVRGTITVTPSVDLLDGQTLTVTGTGFRPDAAIELYPCSATPLPGLLSPCDWAKHVHTDADGTGAFTTTMPAHQIIFGTVDCATHSCRVGAAEAVDFPNTLTGTPISFASPPT